MSSPPPGYNPDASQLHGGTDAPIAKVMGVAVVDLKAIMKHRAFFKGGQMRPL